MGTGIMLSDIDTAFKAFTSLKKEIESILPQIETEEDTRFQIIDRILIEILGWEYGDILREKHVSRGAETESKRGYIDYLLKSGGRNFMVLEAKRAEHNIFDSVNSEMRSYQLYGSTLKSAAPGIQQAKNYCQESCVSPAILTNGCQWIFFKGIRTDGASQDAQKAIVFPDLTAIENNFPAFYELLSKDGVSKNYYEIYMARHENTTHHSSQPYFFVTPDDKVILDKKSALAYDLEPIIKRFFTDMSSTDDPEMLRACFVDTPESRSADQELAKIAENIFSEISSIKDTELAKITTQILDDLSAGVAKSTSEVVLIVGKVGAGKSTYVDRFFHQVLPTHVRKNCCVIRVNMSLFPVESENNLQGWTSAKICSETLNELYPDPDSPPSYKDIKGIFISDFNKKSKLEWALDNPSKKDKKFAAYIEDMKNKNFFDFMRGLLTNGVIKNRRRLPCIVFDNADNLPPDMQEKIFQYAQALRQQIGHMLIITDLPPVN